MKPSDKDSHSLMSCKCVLTTGRLHVTRIGMLHVSRNKVGRSIVHKITSSMTRVNQAIYLALRVD